MIKQGYSYIDISLVPATISNISSRSECNTFDEHGNLPIFASCMSTVVNTDNYKIFKEHNIMPIIPRNIDINKRILLMNNQIWVAVSLTEFNNLFIDNYKDREEQIGHKYYVCVDIANGHMQSLYQSCKKAKEIAENSNYELIIMTGNIANPQTYKWICENSNYLHNGEYHTCIDYIRLSIGTGSQCFVDGTKILMADNTYKNIEDINIGDKVKNISGNINKVCMKTRFKSTKPLIKINNEITSTDDHKYLVINKTDKDLVNENNLMDYAYYIKAKNLDKNKHLLIKYEQE